MQVSHVSSISSKLNTIPIVAGQLIYLTDKPSQYFDVSDTERICIEEIIDLNTEEDREAILAPLSSFYYVRNTNSLWRYDNEWKQLGGSGSKVIIKYWTSSNVGGV